MKNFHPLEQSQAARESRQRVTGLLLERYKIPYLTRDGTRFKLNLDKWQATYWPGVNSWQITKPLQKSGRGLLPLMTILLRLNPDSSSVRTDLQLIQDSWYLWLRLDFEDQTSESASASDSPGTAT